MTNMIMSTWTCEKYDLQNFKNSNDCTSVPLDLVAIHDENFVNKV